MSESAIVDAPDPEPEPAYGRPMSIEEWEAMDEDLDAEGGTVDVPGCDGLKLDLDALWRELDDLVEPEDAPSEP